MSSSLDPNGREIPAGPSARDLIGLAAREVGPPGGAALYRHAALLAGLTSGQDVLDVGCGTAFGLQFLVETFGVHGSGVDVDTHAVERAEARAREAGLADRMHVQVAPMDALPYRDGIFDVSIGGLGTTAGSRPEDAVAEIARVTRPGGSVVLIQLAWTAPVAPARRRRIERLLGFSPLALVEWKRVLSDAGIESIHAEDWSDGRTALRSEAVEPFPDLAVRLSWRERIDVSRRAFKRWGLRGALGVWGEGSRLHRLLAREKLLTLVVLEGTRTGLATVAPIAAPASDRMGTRPSDVSDLPLFGNA
ncbi:MAG: methyltransferase domain-containing protein [Gemmatimonadota bacterium]